MKKNIAGRGFILVGLFVALVLFSLGFFLSNPVNFGLCYVDETIFDASCVNYYNKIGDALYYGMGVVLLAFLALIFIPKAFSWWWKFAIVYVPIATCLYIVTPEPHGWINPITPALVLSTSTTLFLILSILIILANILYRRFVRRESNQ